MPARYVAVGPVVGAERVPAGIPLTNPWARLGAALLDVLLIIVTLFIGWAVVDADRLVEGVRRRASRSAGSAS